MKKTRQVAVIGAALTLAALASSPAATAAGEGGKECCSTTKTAAKAECCSTTKSAATDECCSATKATVREVQLQEVRAISSRKQKGVIIDSRSAADFKAGHIPGAISVPMEKLQSRLPRNKATRLVFYCGSQQCPLSTMAAEKAMKLGYKNVAVYKGGWTGWTQTASR
jgi:rhodanese-related sulfurtransferase